MGGTDEESNLVSLTAREHFICHKLLTKVYPHEPKLIHAFWAMVTMKKEGRTYKITSRDFQTAREGYSKYISERYKGVLPDSFRIQQQKQKMEAMERRMVKIKSFVYMLPVLISSLEYMERAESIRGYYDYIDRLIQVELRYLTMKSPEYREKMSESKKGQIPTNITKVEQLDLKSGRVLKTFNSLDEASFEMIGIWKRGSIIGRAVKRNGTVWGFKWRKKETPYI